jgi:hypothetical protein
MLVTGAVVGSAAAILGGMVAIGVQIGSFAGVYSNGAIWDTLIHGRPGKSIGHVRLPDNRLVDVQRRHARMSSLVRSGPGGPLQLRLEHVGGTELIVGEDAMRIAARIMPTVNRFGGSREKVQDAVGLLEEAGDPYQVLVKVQQRHGWVQGDDVWGTGGVMSKSGSNRNVVRKLRGSLHTLDVRERLAIEMALHEEQERRAMEGELAELERAWQEAEEIAKIADNLFTPAQVEARFNQLRDGTE